MARIDGKYEIVEEKSQGGGQTLYTVRADPKPGAGAGEVLRLAWFEVATSEERSAFHRYRTALKALSPAGLADVVARPGAYYAVWRDVPGAPLASFQLQNVKNELALSNLRELLGRMAAHGYALMDAEIVMDGDTPHIAFLSPAQRTPQEAQSLSEAAMMPLSSGKVRRNRPRLSVWSWLPGLLLLAGAGYLGAQATQIYLNPPISDVPSVVGKAGKDAAGLLTQDGYRVQYVEGDDRNAALGAVIAQEPAGGSNLHLGRLVTLTVNNPPALTVPRFEEQTLDQVKATLAENRLKLGGVTTVDGAISNTPKGRVVAQLPAPGSIIRRGQSVRLLISSGVSVRQTWLPDLRGLPFDDARELVRLAGLVVNSVRKEPSEAAEATVLRQSPAAFSKVDIGSPVTLVVADARYQAPAQATTPLPVPPAPVVPEVAPAPDSAAAQPEFAPSGTDSVPSTSAGTAGTDGASTPGQQIPATPDPSAPPADASRVVAMNYTFPSDLPAGKVEIVVRDDDGERVLLTPTDAAALAGATAQRDDVKVRGNYTFIVRIDGTDFTTFGP